MLHKHVIVSQEALVLVAHAVPVYKERVLMGIFSLLEIIPLFQFDIKQVDLEMELVPAMGVGLVLIVLYMWSHTYYMQFLLLVVSTGYLYVK